MKSKAEVNERKRRAFDLRLRGLSQEEIARTLGVTQQAVSSYFNNIEPTDHMTKEKHNEYVDLMVQRLDKLLSVAMKQAIDDGSLPAVDRVIRLEERRAKLLGLDAPTKQDTEDNGPRLITLIDDIRRKE